MSAAPVPITVLPENREVRIAPDAATRRVVDAPAAASPKIGIFRWQPAGDGTYRPIYQIHAALMRAADFAPLVGISYFTLVRLIRAGFVGGAQPSPNLIQVDVASYFEHQERTKDPDFWTPGRRRAYSEVI